MYLIENLDEELDRNEEEDSSPIINNNDTEPVLSDDP